MPTGKPVSAEKIVEIMRLKSQCLTSEVIAIRTGLHPHTVRRIAKEQSRRK